MCGHQHHVSGMKVRRNGLFPVGQHPVDHVGQALGQGWVYVGVPGVVVGVERVVGRYGWRWCGVAPAPGLELFASVLLPGGGLVQPGQVAVVPFVQSPVAAYRDPGTTEGLEGQVRRVYGPDL